jgi:hypothetical protein
MNKIELLGVFKDKLIKFFDALIEQFPNEGDFVMIRVLIPSIPTEDIMNIFCNRIMPYTDMIKNRDDRFFLENINLFEGIKTDKVNYFKDIWLHGNLTEEDKEQLWKWFILFSNLAVRYSKL